MVIHKMAPVKKSLKIVHPYKKHMKPEDKYVFNLLNCYKYVSG